LGCIFDFYNSCFCNSVPSMVDNGGAAVVKNGTYTGGAQGGALVRDGGI